MGMWRPNKSKGWAQRQEAEPANRFTQILRTVLEVVPGGVIRYGKTGPDDDSHTGFWLGVTPDGVAKFSVGGPSLWLKWTGTELRLCGYIAIKGSAESPNWLQFIGDDGETCGYAMSHDAWGHQVEIGVPRQDAADDPSMIDIFCDGDFGASVRLRCVTYRGQGQDGARFSIIVGNQEAFAVDGYGNVIANCYLTVPDAVAPAQAVNLQTGDARYSVAGHTHPASDHGALTGLGDDDHAQYLNAARGDARYADIDHTHAPAELQQDGAETDDVLTWNGSVWTPATSASGGSDHGALSGLGDDDHTQYHTDARGDLRYAALGHGHTISHDTLTGLGDDDHAQYHTDARGDLRYATLGHGHTVDHGALTGLGDDDHAQYHTDARGDARYLVRSAGVTKTVTVGVGKSMTFVNGQLTGTTGL